MAGDLEEFLKRAAARRQAKGPPQQAAPPPRQATPQRSARPAEYTNRKRERLVREQSDPEPVLVAEIVQETPDPLAKRRKAIEDAKKEAARAQAEAADQLAELQKRSGGVGGPGFSFTGDARADLIRLLRQPGGIKQAILVREILDRPVDRW